MSDNEMDIAARFSLDAIEYPVIIERLAGCTQSVLGRELAEKLLPSSDAVEVASRLDMTDDTRRFFDRESALPTFQGLEDVRDPVGRAGKGGILGAGELRRINAALKAIRSVRHVIREAQFEYPYLTREGQRLGVFPEVEDAIDHAIHPDGEVLDRASSELVRIRKELMRERERAEKTLASMIQTYSRRGYLREANFTIRNGRYVLPFRQDCQKNVKAVVQARSPTGATVFIEPYELVDRNNRLSELKSEEEAEVTRILSELSALVGSRADEIHATLNTAGYLDFAFACGRLSREWKGSRVAQAPRLHFTAARHPLIPPTEVVPVDISFPGEARALIISGPNAGGKTVALKTMGLFAALNQAGLHVPVREGSRMPIFGSVHADIGDLQSIEWNLSSFSAHIVFIKRMLSSLDLPDHRPALVLLDEIGRSTDPQEGSALSLAVIEKLLDVDCFVAVTTHLPTIKNLALSDDGRVAGASVQFDIENAQPLYTIRVGSLGASYAVAIARGLGLDAGILARADALLAEKGDLLAIDIPGLERKLEELEKDVGDVQRAREKARRDLTTLAALERLIVLSAVQDAERVTQEAEKRLVEARKTAALLPHELDREEISDDLKAIRRYGEKLRKAADALAAPVLSGGPAGGAAPGAETAALEVGKPVWVLPLRREGRLEDLGPKRATVVIGGKRLKVRMEELRPLKQEEVTVKRKPPAKTPAHRSLPLYIDLHGLRVEEALQRLDPYLDEAYYQGRERAHVVHGFGTGRLRKGIHEHLKNHPLVEKYELAEVEQGGGGVTVITLKRGK